MLTFNYAGISLFEYRVISSELADSQELKVDSGRKDLTTGHFQFKVSFKFSKNVNHAETASGSVQWLTRIGIIQWTPTGSQIHFITLAWNDT